MTRANLIIVKPTTRAIPTLTTVINARRERVACASRGILQILAGHIWNVTGTKTLTQSSSTTLLVAGLIRHAARPALIASSRVAEFSCRGLLAFDRFDSSR
jgi:hypothetical protein